MTGSLEGCHVGRAVDGNEAGYKTYKVQQTWLPNAFPRWMSQTSGVRFDAEDCHLDESEHSRA